MTETAQGLARQLDLRSEKTGRRMREHGVLEDFALFEDGPFLQLLRRLPFLRAIVDSPPLRVLAAVAITWLPLLALSIQSGLVLHVSSLPFLKDFQTQIRMLVTLPLFIIAGHEAHRVITPALALFMDRGIVREHDRKRFTGILRAASGWNHSIILRLVIVAVIVLFGHDFWKHELASRQLTAWYDGNGTSGITLTLAGYWFVWISNPVFQYLHLLWILRLLMFAAMLARIAALDLHLVATHPDHAGGMGFLGEKLYGFTELVIAEGTAVAGVLANRIIHEGRPLTQFKVDIAIVTVIVSAMVLGPMCVFIPRLLKVKRQGSSEYAELSNHYVREFEEAWVFGKAKAEGRELLGANDVQSLADMANSFNVVTRMRTTPFSNRQAINPMVCFLLPIAPLLLTVFPLEELLVKLIKAFTT